MTETVKTMAERSGMDAAAIAAMLSLDVNAVGAVLAERKDDVAKPAAGVNASEDDAAICMI